MLICGPLYQDTNPVIVYSLPTRNVILSITPQSLSPRTVIWIPFASLKIAFCFAPKVPDTNVRVIFTIPHCNASNSSSEGIDSNSIGWSGVPSSTISIESIVVISFNPL